MSRIDAIRQIGNPWASAGFVDTDVGMLMRLEESTEEKNIQRRVYASGGTVRCAGRCERGAGFEGSERACKGLRHGYDIHVVRSSVQLNMLQKWMGHASIATTSSMRPLSDVRSWSSLTGGGGELCSDGFVECMTSMQFEQSLAHKGQHF